MSQPSPSLGNGQTIPSELPVLPASQATAQGASSDTAELLSPVETMSDRDAPSDLLAPTASSDRAFLWLRRGDQLIVWLLVSLLLGLLGIHWLRLSRWGRAPVELSGQLPREYYYSLDINSASWVEWSQLEGIGEKLARRIVSDREERGPFRNPADVGRVRGVGGKLLQKILPFLRVGTKVRDVAPESSPHVVEPR